MAKENSPFVIHRHRIAAHNLGTNLQLNDDAMDVESTIGFQGNYALVLRLFSNVKSPPAGFSFGRNASQCDVVFSQDPLHRVSNVHFRIYVNEFGSVKIQDESTNGTYVDSMLLTAKAQTTAGRQRTLISGTKIRIRLHETTHDIEFQVQIPHRDEGYEMIYRSRVRKYLQQAVARDTTAGGNTSMFNKRRKVEFAKPTQYNAGAGEWTDSGNTILDFQSTPSLEQIEHFINVSTKTRNLPIDLNPIVVISCQVQWQLFQVYMTELEFGADIGNFVTLTGTPSCAELNTLNRFTENMWDTRMSELIEKIVTGPSVIHGKHRPGYLPT